MKRRGFFGALFGSTAALVLPEVKMPEAKIMEDVIPDIQLTRQTIVFPECTISICDSFSISTISTLSLRKYNG